MHSDWFNGIEILQGGWQNEEKVGYSYPSGLEKTLCKWDIYVPQVTKGLYAAVDIMSTVTYIATTGPSTVSMSLHPLVSSAMENVKLSPCSAPLIPKLGTRCSKEISFTSGCFTPLEKVSAVY